MPCPLSAFPRLCAVIAIPNSKMYLPSQRLIPVVKAILQQQLHSFLSADNTGVTAWWLAQIELPSAATYALGSALRPSGGLRVPVNACPS